MPWTHQPTPPSLPHETPSLSTHCLPCALSLPANPAQQCTRPPSQPNKPCTHCTTTSQPCKPIPGSLHHHVEALRRMRTANTSPDERRRAAEQLKAAVQAWEQKCAMPEDKEEEGNRLLRSLNRNVFRLVQLKRVEMGMEPLGGEEEVLVKGF